MRTQSFVFGRAATLTLLGVIAVLPACGSGDPRASSATGTSTVHQTIESPDLLTRHFETGLPTLTRPDRAGAERLYLRNPSAPVFTAKRVLADGKIATSEVVEVGGRPLEVGRVFVPSNRRLIGTKAFFADLLLVQLAAGVDHAQGRARLEALGYEVAEITSYGLARVRVAVTGAVEIIAAQAAIEQEADLAAHVSLDELVPVTATPNDPYLCGQFQHSANGQFTSYAQQPDGTWGCGPQVPFFDGRNEIGTPQAWDIRTDASSVTVAIIDTGFDYTHPDLAPNAWVNSGEIAGNGVDDDGDGIVDDVHGFNAVTLAGDPQENGDLHGTCVAGVIGARGNNGIGVVGVAWDVKILAVRAEPDGVYGSLSVDAVVRGVDYAIEKGAKVINMSFGTPSPLPTVADAVGRAKGAGILVVTGSGNDGVDIDSSPFFPASYRFQHDNMIVVGGTGWQLGQDWEFNWGARTVDLGAPSEMLITTVPSEVLGPGYPPGYWPFGGTSGAAPLVTGSLALLAAQYPAATYRGLIDRLLAGVVTEPGYAGKCVTGGRLNVYNSMIANTGGVTLPARIEAESYARYGETDTTNSGASVSPQCNRNDGVDQLATTDRGGGCYVGWTLPGEWLEYDVSVAAAGHFDIGARLGSRLDGQTIRVLVDGVAKGTITTPNVGWGTFRNRALVDVPMSAGAHVLRIEFVTGEVDLNFLDIRQFGEAPRVTLPARIEAEDYIRGYELDSRNRGAREAPECDLGDGVDLSATADNNGVCAIGWTRAGEWLEHDVYTAQAGSYEYVLRAATALRGKRLRLVVDGVQQPSHTVRAMGWDHYQDVGTEVYLAAGDHTLRVLFETGDVNLNYLNLIPIATTPARVQASAYARFYDSDLTNNGASDAPECDQGDGVDFAATSDNGGTCSLGWSVAGEWVEYSVRAGTSGKWNLVLRVASGQDHSTVRVFVDGIPVGAFAVQNLGWQVFRDLSIPVNLTNTVSQIRDIRLLFPRGGVDLNYLDFK